MIEAFPKKTERKEQQEAYEPSPEEVIERTMAHIEGMPIQTEEEACIFESVKQALGDIHHALKEGEDGVAYRATQNLIEEYDEIRFNLGDIKELIEKRDPRIADKEVRLEIQEEIESEQKAHYDNIYQKIKEKIQDSNASLAGVVTALGKTPLQRKAKRYLINTLTAGMMAITPLEEVAAESKIQIPGEGNVTKFNSIFEDMQKHFEEALKTPEVFVQYLSKGMWNNIPPEMRIKMLRESIKKGLFNQEYPENVYHHLGRFFADFHTLPETQDLCEEMVEMDPKTFLSIFGENPMLMMKRVMEEKNVIRAIQSEKVSGLDILKHLSYLMNEELMSIESYQFKRVANIAMQRVPYYSALADATKDQKNPFFFPIKNLIEDPALTLLPYIQKEWVAEKTRARESKFARVKFSRRRPVGKNRSLPDMMLMVARNMYLQGIRNKEEVTEKATQEEVEKILALRQEAEDVALFKERSVVLIAGEEHGRLWTHKDDPSDVYRFGKNATAEQIQAQQQNEGDLSFNRFRLDASEENFFEKEDVQEVKEAALRQIAETEERLTIVLEGHGSPEGMHFFDGQVGESFNEEEHTYKIISPEEIANALIKRHSDIKKKVEDGELSEEILNDPPIIVYTSCFNHNQMRSLYEYLEKTPEVQKPIAIGGGEFGQLTKNTRTNKYLTVWANRIFQEKIGTIKHLIESEEEDNPKRGNQSIYIPDPKTNKPIQISESMAPSESEVFSV